MVKLSSVQSCTGNSLYEVTLGNDEESQNWQQHDHGTGQKDMPGGTALGTAAHGDNAHRQRTHLVRGGHDQHPEVIIPAPGEGKQGESGDHRLAERGHDMAQNLQVAGAVDECSIDQIVGNTQKGLANEKGAEGGSAEDRDKSR